MGDRHDQPLFSPVDRTGRSSPVAILIRSEAAVALGLGVAAYWYLGRSWWVFAALILTPDLSLLAYLRGARVGAWVYDLAHTYVGPVALALIGYGLGQPWLMAMAACLREAMSRSIDWSATG